MQSNRALWAFLLLFLLSCSATFAQKITGKVIDAVTKEPLIGATVIIKGSQTGGVTDMDGLFSLPSSLKSANLDVSYVGYLSRSVVWTEAKPLIVQMKEDLQNLDEVVVIGFGVQKKSDLTGAVSSIKASEIAALPSTHVVQALQGKASGVEVVQNSGAPGSSTSIRIRGMGTVNNSDPLYVVDGIPMDDINYLSSDDIESIEILKDASSAAIYGSRAANGVVLVTTKSGKGSTKKFNINFSGYIGQQAVASKPDIMSKNDYIFFDDYVGNSYSKTVKAPDGRLVVRDEYQGLLDKGVNWWDEISRNATMYKVNLAVFGGDKNLNYYISGNLLNSQGIVKESDYARKSLNAKINVKLIENLSLGANITYSREDKTVVNEGQWGIIKTAINYNPLTPIYDINGSYNWTTPVESLRRTTYEWFNNNIIGQLNLDWDIVKGLKFSTRASYTIYSKDIDQFKRYNTNPEIVGDIKYDVRRAPVTSQNFSWDNILNYNTTIEDHSFNVMVGQTMETSNYNETTVEGTGFGGYGDNFDAINFARFNQKGSGYSSAWSSLGLLGRVSYDYANRYLFQANFRADASSRFASQNRWGFFPSLSVGWKINSEAFMRDITWISLLKLRGGWGQLGNNRIKNNEYMNLVVPSYENYIYGSGLPYLKPGMSVTQYGNQDILWERTESYSAGLDFNLFSNRLTTSLDFFVKDTRDMLIAVPIVYSAGWSNTPMQNAGSVRNTGVEFQASYKDRIGDFRYEIGGNISKIKNNITSLGKYGEPILGGNLDNPNNLGYVNRTVLDAPIGCFYGWKTNGIMQPSDFDAQGNPLVPTFASTRKYNPGDMKFADINGDRIIDDNDKTFLGSPHPDFFYGVTINAGYKGFDLSLFFQGVSGNSIYNVTKYFMYSPVQYNGVWPSGGQGNYSNVATDYFDKVYRPAPNPDQPGYRDNWGANPNGTVPAPSSDASRNEMNFRNSDFYIEDGSYLRLKNVQLSYALPQSICQKASIKSLKVYVAATNLFTFTKYSGLDPEVGKRVGEESNNLFIGIDEGTYPQARSYMFGVIFDF